MMRDKILNYYRKVNAFGRLMEMEFEVLQPGEVAYTMRVRNEILATPTAAHGGALAGMMDGVLGVAALSAVADQGKLVATVEFKINYMNPAYLSRQLRGHGKVLQKGNRIIISEGSITGEEGEIICKAMGTFNAYPISKASFYNEFLTAD